MKNNQKNMTNKQKNTKNFTGKYRHKKKIDSGLDIVLWNITHARGQTPCLVCAVYTTLP
jgi:hypothetical protein